MKKYSKEDVYRAMEGVGFVPIFYNPDIQISKSAMKACYDGGVRAFEFTNRGEKAAEVFAELAKYAETLPGMVLGAGSISFARDARKFIRLGAKFIVSPQYVSCVVGVCRRHGIPYMPGCGTISEVGRAQRSGCEICKLFPGDVLGPKFIKALLAPMPWSRIMVTGGVKTEKENLEAWFSAGAACVGIGSNLFPKEALASGDWAKITSICRETVELIKTLK